MYYCWTYIFKIHSILPKATHQQFLSNNNPSIQFVGRVQYTNFFVVLTWVTDPFSCYKIISANFHCLEHFSAFSIHLINAKSLRFKIYQIFYFRIIKSYILKVICVSHLDLLPYDFFIFNVLLKFYQFMFCPLYKICSVTVCCVYLASTLKWQLFSSINFTFPLFLGLRF